MASKGSVTVWIENAKAGDEYARQQIWQRYVTRLTRVALRVLRSSSRRVADEEDVVITAFAKFLANADRGRYPDLKDRTDLWRVLVANVERAAVSQIRYQTSQCRGAGRVRGDSVLQQTANGAHVENDLIGAIDEQPTPAFAALMADELELLLDRLNDAQLRRIAIMRLEGATHAEIATACDVSLRSVERKLRLVRDTWDYELNR